MPEPSRYAIEHPFEMFGPNLRNTSQQVAWQSPAKARLVYAAFERCLADLQALYALPLPEAEAAATALRLQAEAEEAQ